tara:strand:- start:2437 stop:2616 length:180 start_codon:yes stop_codon:yes gene_type:complete
MHNEELETLEQVIVDIPSRKFVLISSTDRREEVDCTMEQFMRVLNLVREMVPSSEVTYV